MKNPVDEAAPQGLAWCLNGVTASTCSATLTPTLAARHGVTSHCIEQLYNRSKLPVMNIVQYESCCQVARSLEVRIHEAELELRRQVAKLSIDSRRLGSN